ncbi:predicted protein [Lichtheimia corymbifera JMRC:FSU:9682]|uniref:Uncharacterized protein n=1 Tax=Lichtheimia corymbifera JMRC:FSU:9682 TaxID=1263082 RepID=A0A068RK05_9FUNG|nr:predicted protein [Lichtheimia corymbifera JMRC:FSU:9682]
MNHLILYSFGIRTPSMCTTIVDNAKKMKMSMDQAAELMSTLPKPKSSSMYCCRGIKKRLALESTTRSSVFIKYIKQIVDCSPRQHNLQVAIRTSSISPSDYDCHVHADFRIAEKLMHHMFDLIQAFVEILHERTAACSTTIFLINTLCLSCNDTLKLKWIIFNAAPFGSVEWDGLGLAVGDACPDAVPMVVEFTGGIHTHTHTHTHTTHTHEHTHEHTGEHVILYTKTHSEFGCYHCQYWIPSRLSSTPYHAQKVYHVTDPTSKALGQAS